MARTKHFGKRISQRGITLDVVDLARQFGVPDGDKIILGRKTLEKVLKAIWDLERTAVRAMDKGGIVVVEDGETQITAYDRDSYRRPKGRRRRSH